MMHPPSLKKSSQFGTGRQVLARRPRRLLLAAFACSLLAPSVGLVRSASASAGGAVRVLVVPPTTRGDVRSIYLKRITRGIGRTLSFSGRITVTKDSDRPTQKGKANAIGARKATPLEKQIEKADRLRNLGMENETKDPIKAYALFKKAISLYEGAAAELVDFTKLADAYTRAGLAAFKNRAGTKNVRVWFVKGLALQPTLVINRRGQSTKLLKLFDATVKRTRQMKKVGVQVISGCPSKACADAVCYIDGIKRGALPARNDALIRGAHFIQLRGPHIKPWGKIVYIGRPNFTVKAKPKMLKIKTVKQVVVLGFDAIAACAKKGNFAAQKCNKKAKYMMRQTDSAMMLFSLIKSDRYGRLTLHGFLVRTPAKSRRPAKMVALKAVSMKKNLADLNARLTDFAAIVDKAAAAFPTDRALRKVPRAFK